MNEKVKENYDAFISYRHAELDQFVAVELHKVLENFRLPKNVKKVRTFRARLRSNEYFGIGMSCHYPAICRILSCRHWNAPNI